MSADIQAMLARAAASNRFKGMRAPAIPIGRKTKDPIDSFMKAQVKKFRTGKDLRCSDGLALKIRRKAIEEDMGV